MCRNVRLLCVRPFEEKSERCSAFFVFCAFKMSLNPFSLEDLRVRGLTAIKSERLPFGAYFETNESFWGDVHVLQLPEEVRYNRVKTLYSRKQIFCV